MYLTPLLLTPLLLPNRLHHTRHRAIPVGRDQQMDVIGHQHISMDITTADPGSRLQAFQVKQVIILVEKAGLTIITTLNHVLGHAGQVEAGQAGHGLAAKRCLYCLALYQDWS
ncbi:hypothetical protein ACS8Y6_17825 [Salinisphaera sp. RV14]|uniref:hypothetical protein n=1 Tax=Salinisphaera sp. RV14 TaxID=3454140 RepID=UPI003F86941B